MSRRTEMLASIIQRELMRIIQRELSDPRITGMPSINRVKVSDDLAFADVFVTIMGTEAQRNLSLNALKHSAGLMRTKLTKALTLRVAPFIRVQMDHDLAKELVVLDLLRKAREESAELERRHAEQSNPGSSVSESEDPSATPSHRDLNLNGEIQSEPQDQQTTQPPQPE